ncbi:MAG TPA: phosphoribosylaminoimidazolecarboxamide formyltransferase [Phycisphaerae bacterium]|nr:phosphoribosylaminoimidazolecarboxamide formyltransferase [Phycisphaerae bacterium]HOI54015.1 phosphoribosylaminoimidazolecarboxamide formyltransferase [Phycisphaerae bacterium]
METKLKYGCNPHQGQSRLIVPGDPPPLEMLNGTPGYINLLDAIGAWQLVRELRLATGKPGAASFKHVSPAGAAIARPLDEAFLKSQFLDREDLSPVATAYVRARGGDRLCSFGDVAAVSDTVDASLARVLAREVCDLIIAPGYDADALEILKNKRGGKFLILRIDPDYEPPAVESRQLFGFTLEQQRNDARIATGMFKKPVTPGAKVPDDVAETLAVATITLKYTQSNSVCLAYQGQVIGNGAGQQSRVHCMRLACSKADKWFMQQHPKVLGLKFKEGLMKAEKANVVDQYLIWDELSEPEERFMLSQLTARPEPLTRKERTDWIAKFDDVCVSSDAFFPFRDSIDRASRSHVKYVAHPGGSLRDESVTEAAHEYGMIMIHTGVRCFLH